MDDPLLFTPSKKLHIAKWENLLKALLKNGLKMSPKKCQLFRTELQYMGNIIFIKDRRVCVKPLRSRLEVIQKLQPLTKIKGCRSFAGMANFLSIFCPELQKLLKSIWFNQERYTIYVWKGTTNILWRNKAQIDKTTSFTLTHNTGRFHLYSDTSKFSVGSALYQIQNGITKLIAYASKILPEAARNYSIRELELCGLDINIANFSHLLE